jgi:hypothetical protein
MFLSSTVSVVELIVVVVPPTVKSPETVNPVSVPTDVIADWAACVTVNAVPEALPVTLPVNGPLNPAAVNKPVLGLYVRPVSVSIPCVPVAPSTNVGYTVSSVELLATAVMLVASVAVSAFPVIPPETVKAVRVPTEVIAV